MKKRHFITIEKLPFIVAASVGFHTPMHAEETTPKPATGELPETTIVSARGYETLLSSTPGGVDTVMGSAIFEDVPASVSDLADFMPGVTRSGDSPWGSDINIRGLSRNAVVVLVDGSRLETPTPINARLGMIDPSSIERIEVLKGPISSLYGSGSLGGVVNIITKGGQFSDTPTFGGSFSLTAKSNPSGFTSSLWASWAAPDHYLDVFLSGRDFDSYEDGDGREMRNSQYSDWQAIIKAGYKLNDHSTLRTQIQYSDASNIGIPAGHQYLPAHGQWVTYPETSRGLFDLSYTLQPQGKYWQESELKLFYHFNRRNVIINRFPAPAPIDHLRLKADHDTYGAKWQNKIETDKHTIVAGIDAWHRTLWSKRMRFLKNGRSVQDKAIPDSTFTSIGIFAEDSWEVNDRLTLSFGARLDSIEVENNAFGPWDARNEEDISWNAHFGAVYELTDSLSTKAIISSGYRSPSLEERYAYINLGGGSVLLGNPDLNSERSIFFEWGFDWTTEDVNLSATAFYNGLDDFVVVQGIQGTPHQGYANVSKARIYGVELKGEWKFADCYTLYGNLSYTNGKDTELNDELPNIAPFSGLVGIRYKNDNGFWGLLETQFAADQDDTPAGTSPVDGWEVVNLRIGYDFEVGKTKQSIYVGVDNLFDATYQNYLSSSRSGTVSLIEPGRSFNMGWKAEF